MLKEMRKTASSWIIKILLSLIVIAFIFMGVGNYRSQEASKIGSVNGEPITIDEYRTTYRDIIERLRQQFGDRLNNEFIEMFQVKKQAIDQIVGQKLILQEAGKLGLKVTDDELSSSIKRIGAFQEGGQFSPNRYSQILQRISLTPEQFEDRQRESILVEKMQGLITESVKVSATEAREWHRWQEATVEFDLAWFNPSNYTDTAPSESELKAYYNEHRDKYKTEPKRQVRYVRFLPADYRQKIAVAEEDVRNYYEENPSRYKTPKTVEARHILLKVPADADDETVARVEAKAKEIAEQARQKGQDFAALAKEFSEGPSRDKGGFLGAFKREDMVKPFSDRAFAMAAGEISDPVRTRFGWHVIKVEKVNPESTLTFEAAKPQIEEILTDDLAKNMAYDDAESVFEISLEGDDLVSAAQEKSTSLVSTDFFTRNGLIRGIADQQTFREIAFGLKNGEISDVIEMSDGYYIIQVMETKPAVNAEYQEAEKSVAADLTRELQDGKAAADADQFLASVSNGGEWESGLKTYRLQNLAVGPVKRNDPVPGVGGENRINEAAFQLTMASPLSPSVIKGQRGYFVVRLKDRKEPDAAAFESDKDSVRQRLLQQKKMKAFGDWVAQLKEQSEITIKEEIL